MPAVTTSSAHYISENTDKFCNKKKAIKEWQMEVETNMSFMADHMIIYIKN